MGHFSFIRTRLIAGGAAALIAVTVPNAFAASIGAPAPAFSVIDADGNAVSLDGLKGKTVVLEWTNKDCPYVRKHYDGRNMQGLQASLDATWITVLSSAPGKQGHLSAAEAKAHAMKVGASPDHIIIDEAGTLGRLYGASTTPHMFVIDPSGVLSYMGAIDDQPSGRLETLEGAVNYVSAAVGEIAAGKAVSVSSANPYGCSVKY